MRFLFSVFLIVTTVSVMAQSTYLTGFLPTIAVSKKLQNDWSLNGKVESRQSFATGQFGENPQFGYEYLLTDLSVIVSKRMPKAYTLGVGYLLRIKSDGFVGHRSIQQYSFANRYGTLRLSHRWSADQLFAKNEKPELRFRYRASLELPLAAEQPSNYYFKLNNEYLYITNLDETDVEIRLIPYIGRNISPTSKIELGIDYRINSFIQSSTSHRFWLAFNFVQSI